VEYNNILPVSRYLLLILHFPGLLSKTLKRLPDDLVLLFPKTSTTRSMVVSCSSKASLKRIRRLLYATLRCPPSTRDYRGGIRCCWAISGSYKYLALVDHPTSIIFDNSSSQNLLWPYDGLCGFSSSPKIPNTLSPEVMSRLVQPDKRDIPEIIKTMTKKSHAVPKRSPDSSMQSRVQGGVYESSSRALPGFYSSSSHSLCAFPK